MSGPKVLVDAEDLRTLLRFAGEQDAKHPSDAITGIIDRLGDLTLIEIQRMELGKGPTHYLTITDEESVEVFAALTLASQVYAWTADLVMSRFYADIEVALRMRASSNA